VKKNSIAAIGAGFVGGSFTTGMSHAFNVYSYDKAGNIAKFGIVEFTDNKGFRYRPENIPQFVEACEAESTFLGIFCVAVPTPMYEDGECDVSIVESVLSEIASTPVSNTKAKSRIAMVKSTVPPGSVERWNKMFNEKGLEVIHNPEFLTERNALEDFKNQDRIVLGGPHKAVNRVKQMYQTAFPNVSIIKTSSTTSEMVKYFTNIQLAVRVILSSELWQLTNALNDKGLNVDYDKVKEYANYDKRLGGSHMNVPGDNGVAGARGHCFPKDLNALIAVAKQVGVLPTVMEAAWQKNIEVVPAEHRDWELMKGRAVSKREK